MEKRIVKVGAFDKRYEKGEIYYALPYFDSSTGNYVTGQERWTGDKDGLTRRQIEGLDPLTDKQREKIESPIIMDGIRFRGIPISRHTKFDLTEDENGIPLHPVDVRDFNFFAIGQQNIIAPSKSEAKINKHLFYFVDEGKEVRDRIEKKRKVFKAVSEVMKKLNADSYYELLLTVNYNYKENYNLNSTSSDDLTDYIFEVCEKHPEAIELHFSEKGQDELFVLKLLHYEVLTITDGMFISSTGKIVGNTPREVIAWANQKGHHISLSSWKKSLEKKDLRYREHLEKLNKKK